MTFKAIIFAAICSGVSLPAVAQESIQAPAAVQQYENWEQFSPQVQAALLFIMAAGFDGLAEVDEKGLNPDSPQAHAVFLEHVLKLDVSFLNGQDRDYFEAVLRVNRSRLAALQALPEDAGKDAVEEIRTQHAKELNVYKKQYGYEKVDDIVIQYLPVMQQKYMQQCVAAHPGSMRAILREFAKKLREESIMQH